MTFIDFVQVDLTMMFLGFILGMFFAFIVSPFYKR